MSADTLAHIYSVSKLITVAATIILFEQGKFHINDAVKQYLPEFVQRVAGLPLQFEPGMRYHSSIGDYLRSYQVVLNA